MGSGRYYLYAIIRTDRDRIFPVASIDGAGRRVHTVSFMDLAAVVSPAEKEHYEVSRQHTLAHELVLETVMKEHILLPVKFGTIAASRRHLIERLLKRKYGEFHGFLNYLQGRVELGIKAIWKRDALFEQILTDNPHLKKLRDSLAGSSEAEARMERIRLGQLVEQAIDARRDLDTDTIMAALRPLAAEVRVNKPIVDNMVLNAAFLVPTQGQAAFDAAVNSLDERYAGKVLFKYVGPVPPYNFVHIVVQWND